MKAKRIFYMYGNDRQFADEYLISTITGEPMARKWQRFMELTPEEKARWDAALRLDAEYRIAEAQDFPNGIPGGRIRGNALYTLTQMEEEHERDLQRIASEKREQQYGPYLTSRKTDIQDNTSDMFGNIKPADNLWQNPFDIWKDRPNPVIPAASELQMGNNPAFDPLNLRQAILDFAEKVRQTMNSSYAKQTPKQPTANRTEPAAAKMADNDSAAPAVYDNGQTNKNDAVVPASLQEREYPPRSSAGDKAEIRSNMPAPAKYTKTQQVQKTNAIARYNFNQKTNGYASHNSAEPSTPAPNSNEEEASFWDKIVGTIGQYGDGGTVPAVPWFDANSPEDARTFNQKIQQYSSILIKEETLPSDLEKARQDAISYAISYGIDGIETIIAILMPPQLKGLLAVVLFTKAVCEMAVAIKQKRDREIEKIKNRTEYTDTQKKQMIDDQMTAWILEEVGKGLLDKMLDMVLTKVKLPGGEDIPEHIKLHVKTTWDEFIISD